MKKLGILLAVVLFGLVVFAQADLESIVNRIELLEEYANMIYDAVGTKVATEDFEAYVAEMEDRISSLETELLNVKSSVETGMPALRDMLYELSANIAAVEERLTSYIQVALESLGAEVPEGSALESLLLKVDMHDQDIVNIYDNLATKADREQFDILEASVTELYDTVNGLNEILTGLAAQIGDTDYLLRKQIEDLKKTLDSSIAAKADTQLVSEIANRIELLEEYANMMYDTLNNKISQDDLEELYSALDELSEKLLSMNEEIMSMIEDLKVTLDIHDSDILKIYDTLGTMSEDLAKVQETVNGNVEEIEKLSTRVDILEDYANMIFDTMGTKVSQEDFAATIEEINENIKKVNTDLNAKISKVSEDTNKKIEDTNKKLDTVQMLSILGIGLGAVAIILKFVNF